MKHNRKIIYLVGFLFSIPLALTSYINSSFLEIYIRESYIGIIYAIASIITIWGLFKMPKIVARLGNRFSTLVFCILTFLSLLALAFANKIYVAIPAFIVYFASTSFIIASLDIFIEDFSKNSPVGSLRGFYLMIINLAWVIAQMISGSIINKSSFLGIYLFSAGFMVLVLVIFMSSLRDFKDPAYRKISLLKTIKTFIKNKHISKAYLINFIVKFFYAWMVIYTPIYLHEYIGFDWGKIGLIFSIMLLPFVILDFPLGKLSDKIGEKKMLLLGFVIVIISVLVIPFISIQSLYIWALVLFMIRVGAATVEVMSESYFFKVINIKECPDEISFFRNTYPLSYIIAPLLAIPILLFIPSFKYLFIVLSAVLLGGLFITLRLRDVK